jgi:3-phenylpropionate/trans-cinnamate dioxygenase ferredoxin subunit
VSSHTVAHVDDLRSGDAMRVDAAGHKICLARIGEEWFAIGDTCSHADFPLSAGMVWPDDCAVECPKHGALFSLRTGQPNSLPATVPVAVYAVRVVGDDVVVEVP